MSKYRRDIFTYTYEEFDFLLDLGYSREVTSEKAKFFSNSFLWVISKNRYEEAPTEKLFLAKNEKEVASPYLALQFYLPDYISQMAKITEKYIGLPENFRTVSIEANFLKQNNWIFLDTKWTGDSELKCAIDDLNSWLSKSISNGVFPSHQESVEFLRSRRPG